MKNLKLWPHQQAALKYLKLRCNGALFMEMRLGKTPTIIEHLREKSPVLVICPNQVVDEWGILLAKHGIDNVCLLTGVKTKKLIALRGPQCAWYVINYEAAESCEVHKIFNWYAVILDESRKIANPQTAITKYCLASFRNAQHRYVLCGEPRPESELEYFTQFHFLNQSFMGYSNYWKFKNDKYDPIGFNWVPKNETLKSIYLYVHRNAFVLSRKDAGKGPDKEYRTRYVDINKEQRTQYAAIKEDFEFGSREEKTVLGQLISFARIAGGCSCVEPHGVISKAKLIEIRTLLREDLAGEKVLIWCRFVREAEIISEFLYLQMINAIHIDGNTSREDREYAKKLFEDSATHNVAVLTIASSAKGRDWSAANAAIYYSNEYSYDLRAQSEERTTHLNKTRTQLIIDLISRGTLDEEVLRLLKDEKKFDSKRFMSKLIMRLTNG